MFKRLELHNHTTESDASLTLLQLVETMVEDGVDGFALTDHNTISGHAKMQALLSRTHRPIECIDGMEYTTYYGHILCLNLHQYVPWENINLHHPEPLFQAVRDTGALAGVAHPFSMGAPFARGCGWDMEITDFTALDFIEVLNNAESLCAVNAKGLAWWESLVLQGYRLAMTAGMDMHSPVSMAGDFAVYVDCAAGETLPDALARAVRTQRTHVTRGPVFTCRVEGDMLHCLVTDVVKKGYVASPQRPLVARFHFAGGEVAIPLANGRTTLSRAAIGFPRVVVPYLYEGGNSLEEMVAIAPVAYFAPSVG
ncbi:MAG: CehA/McbA family metallohydrolase [Clostridia bacterium]